jgi:quinol monooxygenase YgiN
MKITKKVVFVAKDESINELKALLDMMIEPSRAESGCELYNIYRLKNDPKTFVVIETWTDEVSLKGHQNSAHYAEYKSKFEPFCAEKFSDEMESLI